MFADILAFLSAGITDVFTLFFDVFSGGIAIFWDDTPITGGITNVGELVLLGALVSLTLFGIRFVRSMIPFMR